MGSTRGRRPVPLICGGGRRRSRRSASSGTPTTSVDFFSGCDSFEDNGGPLDADPTSCQVNQVKSSNGYKERLVEVIVPIPDDFPGGVDDTTTWSAEIIGDPVRLTE